VLPAKMRGIYGNRNPGLYPPFVFLPFEVSISDGFREKPPKWHVVCKKIQSNSEPNILKAQVLVICSNTKEAFKNGKKPT
jgi:hypothetical protein